MKTLQVLTLSLGIALLTPLANATVLLQDDFTTISASTWTTSNTSGAFVSNPTSTYRSVVSSGGANPRAFLVSTATNLNPFAAPLVVDLSTVAVSGDPPVNGARMFFAIVGRANDDAVANYFPNITGTFNNYNGTGSGALALTLQQRSNGSGGSAYYVQVFDYGSTSTASALFEVTAMPSSVSWTINGATDTWSVSIGGATFSSGGGTSQSGSFSNYTETSVSRLSLGNINYPTGASPSFPVAGATSKYYDLGGVTVTAVPEPKLLVLMLAVLIPWVGLVVRKRLLAQRAVLHECPLMKTIGSSSRPGAPREIGG